VLLVPVVLHAAPPSSPSALFIRVSPHPASGQDWDALVASQALTLSSHSRGQEVINCFWHLGVLRSEGSPPSHHTGNHFKVHHHEASAVKLEAMLIWQFSRKAAVTLTAPSLATSAPVKPPEQTKRQWVRLARHTCGWKHPADQFWWWWPNCHLGMSTPTQTLATGPTLPGSTLSHWSTNVFPPHVSRAPPPQSQAPCSPQTPQAQAGSSLRPDLATTVSKNNVPNTAVVPPFQHLQTPSVYDTTADDSSGLTYPSHTGPSLHSNDVLWTGPVHKYRTKSFSKSYFQKTKILPSVYLNSYPSQGRA
jgi:hypothetical protein